MMGCGGEIKKISRGLAMHIISTRKPLGLFYVLESGIYTGIDNLSGNAWTESFTDLRKCECWLGNPNIEMEEFYEQ